MWTIGYVARLSDRAVFNGTLRGSHGSWVVYYASLPEELRILWSFSSKEAAARACAESGHAHHGHYFATAIDARESVDSRVSEARRNGSF